MNWNAGTGGVGGAGHVLYVWKTDTLQVYLISIISQEENLFNVKRHFKLELGGYLFLQTR